MVNIAQRPDLFTVNVKAVTTTQKCSACRQQWYIVKARVLWDNLHPCTFCEEIQMKNTEVVIAVGGQICNDEEKETLFYWVSSYVWDVCYIILGKNKCNHDNSKMTLELCEPCYSHGMLMINGSPVGLWSVFISFSCLKEDNEVFLQMVTETSSQAWEQHGTKPKAVCLVEGKVGRHGLSGDESYLLLKLRADK